MIKIFSLRKSNFSKFSGKSFDLLSSASWPAVENNLSTSVEVGGGVRYFLMENKVAKPESLEY